MTKILPVLICYRNHQFKETVEAKK